MKEKALNDCVSVYKKQLAKGDIKVAYTELVKYVMKLKMQFSKELADKFSFGNIFQGYMDYTYFYYSNEYLNKRKLKFGLVLNHLDMRFEIWLLGQTKDIQKKYWSALKHTHWITTDDIPQYSIFDLVILDNPDFNDLDILSNQIKKKLITASDDILNTLKTV
jgi:hypothetical protein